MPATIPPANFGHGYSKTQPSKRSKTFIANRDIAIFSLYALLTISWVSPFLTQLADAGAVNALRQGGYVLVFALALISSQTFSRLQNLLDIPSTIMLALGFCWLSVAWSFDPGNSIRKLFLTTIVLSTAFLLVRVIGYRETVRILQRELAVLILMSFVLVAVAPGLGIHQISEITADDLIGDWRGIFGHKNAAGPAASFLILTLLLAPMGMRSWMRGAMLLAAAFFLYQTGSKTALALVGLCACIGYLTGRYRAHFRAVPLAIFLTASFLATAYIFVNWNEISAPFLEEEALTGRGSIWSALLSFSNDHHLGAGFGSFWSIDGAQPIDSYTKPKSWVAELGSSHNGYLELLVTVGPIGLVLGVVAFALSPLLRIFSSYYLPPHRRGYLTAVIFYALIANFTETTLLDRDQPVFVVLTLAIALIGVGRMRPQPRPSWITAEPLLTPPRKVDHRSMQTGQREG